MSMELMVKAMKIKVGNSGRKLVLLKLADNADDNGNCWPSYQHIADQCEMCRRTVIDHVKQLEKDGFLTKSHRNSGNSSNYYKLNLDAPEVKKTSAKSAPVENCTSAKSAPPSAKSAPPSSAKSAPRTSHSFEPVNEPKKNKQKKAAEFSWRDSLIQLGADVVDVRDLMLVRKEKKATNTEAAFRRFLNQCEKAGCSVREAVEICAERGWSAFQADWDSFQSELASKHGLAPIKQSSRPSQSANQPLLGEDIDSAWEDDL
ncbi:MAG: helix-turn-helix domain-containing protein [Gammaproteobacteria bacterium]|nr:helix-turn-helix domain-containing protein [Gammaproteobacteria bacterium]